MRGSQSTLHSPDFRSSGKTRRWEPASLINTARWMARKIAERRNRNALLELSDDQLKDIGLSRGQTESDVHIYCRY
jgi:uncharacterized protein YjiS (DUF1127 family)